MVEEEVPQFAKNLSDTVQKEQAQVVNSTETISAVVNILNTIANVSTAVNETVMQVSETLHFAVLVKHLGFVADTVLFDEVAPLQ